MYHIEDGSDFFWISLGWLIALLQVLAIVTGHPELGIDRYAWVILIIIVGLLGLAFHRFLKKTPWISM